MTAGEPAFVLPRFAVERSASSSDSVDLGPAISDIREFRDVEGGVAARGRLHAEGAWVELFGVGHYHFHAAENLVVGVPRPSVPDEVVHDRFTRAVLPHLLPLRGVECLHASAVSTPAGVVGFCGVPGSGKSTLAAALARLGYPIWADDALAFSVQPQGIVSVPLPFASRLLPDSLALLRSVEERAAGEPAGDREPLPLVGVFALSRTEETDARIDRLAPGAAFVAVLEHSRGISLDPIQSRRRLTEQQLALVGAVPVFLLSFRPSAARFADVVRLVADRLDDIAAARLSAAPQG